MSGGASRVVAAGTLLEPEALTIGFARRFTAYKRPELIFHDQERLAPLLSDEERPVQIVFAGKAHPRRPAGKASSAARSTVAPLDAMLQRPRRLRRRLRPARGALPGAGRATYGSTTRAARSKRAGTSGMKAAINGVPHLSIRATAGGPKATTATTAG
ncbi:MAG: hypothetical protein QM736_28180 [Vicinamibacterales bacterium]